MLAPLELLGDLGPVVGHPERPRVTARGPQLLEPPVRRDRRIADPLDAIVERAGQEVVDERAGQEVVVDERAGQEVVDERLVSDVLPLELVGEVVAEPVDVAFPAGLVLAHRSASLAGATISPYTRSCSSAVINRSEEHTSELQSRENLVCRLLLEK